jgi:hypothetical protein
MQLHPKKVYLMQLIMRPVSMSAHSPTSAPHYIGPPRLLNERGGLTVLMHHARNHTRPIHNASVMRVYNADVLSLPEL